MFQSGAVLSPGPVTGSLLVTETMRQTGLGSQLSLARAVRVMGSRWWFAGLRSGGSTVNERMLGGVRSVTLSRAVAALVLPAASVTVTCTANTPKPTTVPAAG